MGDRSASFIEVQGRKPGPRAQLSRGEQPISGQPQVHASKQRVQLRGVLLQTAVAHSGKRSLGLFRINIYLRLLSMTQNSTEQSQKRAYRYSLGVAFGIVFGAALGAAFDQLAAGVALGVALGPAFGVAIGVARSPREKA